MSTERQKKALDNLVGNGGNVTKAMRDAEYSENTLNTPQKLTESKGFKELCDEHGLTENLLVVSLVEDIKAKPQNRKAEIELGVKMRGLLTENLDIKSDGEKIVITGFNYVKQNEANNKTTTETGPGMASPEGSDS